ncbi:MAG: 3-phosphoshikimate 1-carboxyvinyltransferase [Helicobacteraceae bacterium]|jgi:3-phosphoshikimate 1-carboxyvinyltransferase|nr:3-phosphoshikimate 1-carboxyvinyltransferase [Helicobacteraceae bacterium]
MKRLIVAPSKSIVGAVGDLAGDKSISHRAAIFSLLSDRPSTATNFLRAEDTLRSLAISERLGATIIWNGDALTIKPPSMIEEPNDYLDCGNAGTAMRLFAGLLCAQNGFFVLSGDRYLNNRPMRRIVAPLKTIGAAIDGRKAASFAPLAIRGVPNLARFDYESSIGSAQVKSAMILAGLNANGGVFSEPELSRDHTERMLKAMGADIRVQNGKIAVGKKTAPLAPLAIRIPADPSSGFFFAVAAAITQGGDLLLRNVTLNPSRIEAYKTLGRMGAKVEFIARENDYEPIGDIRVRHGELNGAEVSQNVSWLIDEAPALAIAFAYAKGVSRLSGAAELRVKESDRIASVVSNLTKCGVRAKELPDGFEITGQTAISGATIDSFGDHRIAMSFAIAALGAKSEMVINDSECVATSFPRFADILKSLGGAIEEQTVAD